MNPFEIIGGIVLLISGIIIVVTIMLQESKQANGMDAMTGGSTDNYVGKNGANTKEAFLAKMTKMLAIIFIVIAFALNLVVKFMN